MALVECARVKTSPRRALVVTVIHIIGKKSIYG